VGGCGLLISRDLHHQVGEAAEGGVQDLGGAKGGAWMGGVCGMRGPGCDVDESLRVQQGQGRKGAS